MESNATAVKPRRRRKPPTGPKRKEQQELSMRQLIDRGLLNAGLVKIDTPELLARYNDALVRLGIEPTQRTSIHIDGVGWSPELVADRQYDRFYLTHGVINPLAIIVTPEQYRKPVYFPVFSWMRELMRSVFDKYFKEIADITATHAVSLDLENGLSTLEGPLDLTLLSSIIVHPMVGDIAEAAKEQRVMIEQFLSDLNCLKKDMGDQLVAHRDRFGDLRKRRFEMGAVTFDNFQDFYTVAFSGAAVLRKVGDRDLLILEDETTFNSLAREEYGETDVCFLYDKEGKPFQILRDAGWITLPLEKYRQNLGLLEEKKDLLLAYSLSDCDGVSSWENLTPGQRKAILKAHNGKVPEIFFELERFAASLKRGAAVPKLSPELWYFLAVPDEKLHPSSKEVVWILLTRKEPRNILEFYTYDKNAFLRSYEKWKEEKQHWAASYLASRYKPRMSQP